MRRTASILCLGVAGFAGSVVGQSPASWDAGRLQLTRPELELLLKKFDETGRSESRSDEFRLRARSEADLIRRRLIDGDFQVGDQVVLNIEGEANMPLTLTVAPGRVLPIPSLSELTLVGVLRSELNEKVLAHVARYIQNPVVRTQSMIRIAVFGQVRDPGFRTVAAESILSDVIMAAGGPAPTAKLNASRIERGSERIWDGQVLQEAIAEGRTLDQMSLRSGDQFVVPQDSGGRGATLLRAATIIPAAILAVTGLLRIL